MKKIIFAFLFAITATTLMAQSQQQKVSTSEVKATPTTKADNYAAIKFDTLFHDFGTFSKLDPIVKCVFRFTNTGTAPLIIHQAFASCGCTVPDYSKEPVRPGEKGEINVTYNGTDKMPGRFKKTITIRSNAGGDDEIVRLTISGDME